MISKKFQKIRNILFYNKFTSYSDIRLRKFVSAAAQMVGNNEKLLDAGAGECQYKAYFKHAEYTSQDLGIGDSSWDFSQIDIKSEIYDIPVENNSFDHILCIEVMEHLKYPHRAFKEFSRILRSGGKLFVVCPLTWSEHQIPHDFFRYTRYALKMLAEDNDFNIESINAMGGRHILLAQIIHETFNIYLAFLYKNHLKYLGYICKIVFFPFLFILLFFLYYLDKTDKKKHLTMQYECVFTRK